MKLFTIDTLQLSNMGLLVWRCDRSISSLRRHVRFEELAQGQRAGGEEAHRPLAESERSGAECGPMPAAVG